MARIGVDEAAGRGDGNTVEQLPAHPECLGRRGDTHSVDCEALEDPAGDPVGHFRSIVGARQRALEDLPAAGGVGAGEAGNEDVQAGGEPHDREVDEAALDMISLCPWVEQPGQVSETSTGEALMMVRAPTSAASVMLTPISAVRQMVSATRLPVGCPSRVLVRSDVGVVALILYRQGPLHVVPHRSRPAGSYALRITKSHQKPVSTIRGSGPLSPRPCSEQQQTLPEAPTPSRCSSCASCPPSASPTASSCGRCHHRNTCLGHPYAKRGYSYEK